jgi:hypothetical protein
VPASQLANLSDPPQVRAQGARDGRPLGRAGPFDRACLPTSITRHIAPPIHSAAASPPAARETTCQATLAPAAVTPSPAITSKTTSTPAVTSEATAPAAPAAPTECDALYQTWHRAETATCLQQISGRSRLA